MSRPPGLRMLSRRSTVPTGRHPKQYRTPSCEPITTLPSAIAGEADSGARGVELPELLAALEVENVEPPVARADVDAPVGGGG